MRVPDSLLCHYGGCDCLPQVRREDSGGTGIPLDPPKASSADVLKKVVFWWLAITVFGGVLWVILYVWGQQEAKREWERLQEDARVEEVRLKEEYEEELSRIQERQREEQQKVQDSIDRARRALDALD